MGECSADVSEVDVLAEAKRLKKAAKRAALEAAEGSEDAVTVDALAAKRLRNVETQEALVGEVNGEGVDEVLEAKRLRKAANRAAREALAVEVELAEAKRQKKVAKRAAAEAV